jgi:hypothetical protein
MRIFAILVILHNSDLYQERSQRLAILASTNVIERNVNPAFGLFEAKSRKGN